MGGKVAPEVPEKYVSWQTLYNWVIVLLGLEFFLMFALWWVLPQSKEIEQLRGEIEKIEEQKEAMRNVPHIFFSDPGFDKRLIKIEEKIDVVSIRATGTVIGVAERKREIDKLDIQLKKIFSEIASLERNIADMARNQGITLSTDKQQRKRSVVNPRARVRP